MYSFSLVIPHHNSPELLRFLLKSIPVREDLQVIIVDDNSDPSIVDFDNFPGSNRNDTVVVFSKEGKGAGYARNVGLQKVQGKWIIFSDADDYFDTENLNKALDTYVDSDADIVFFNANRVEETTGKVLSQHLSKRKFEKSPQKYKDFLRYWSNVPWAKFIKREIITNNDVFFSEVPSANDLYFSTVSGFYAKKVLVDFSVIYNYRVRLSGNITSHVSEQTVMSRLSEASKRNAFLWNKGEKAWCTNLYMVFYERLRCVGHSRRDALSIIGHSLTVGPKKSWYLSFLANEPIVFLRRVLRKSFDL